MSIKKRKKTNKLSEDQVIVLRRREFIAGLFTSFGGLGLKSMLLGLPPAFLARRAMAATNPTFLVFTTRRHAGPVNAHVPGTYINGLYHPREIGGVNVNLGGTNYTGARAWADMPATFRSQTNFFHHATLASAHPEAQKTMRINGSLLGQGGAGVEMLPSAIAQQTASGLGTVSSAPIVLGNTLFDMTNNGSVLSEFSPLPLKQVLGRRLGNQRRQMAAFRDRQIDSLYESVKSGGTAAQREYLDRHVNTRDQARKLTEDFVQLLADVDGNSETDRVLAAVAVLASGTAPAVVFGIDFGGDTHVDRGYANEIRALGTGTASISALHNRLRAMNLGDRTTYAQMNVFGRTLAYKPDFDRQNREGRDHNRGHSVMVMSGPKVRAGVTGSIIPERGRMGGEASGINSGNGTASNPDITQEQTLPSAAKTLMKACGLDDSEISGRIDSGKVVRSAINS